jgi:acetyl-CoA C-acetyltransferase
MAQGIRDRVAVIGAGCTKFGDNFAQSYEDLVVEAAFEAFRDAKIEPERIEAAWLGTYSPYAGRGKASVSLADALRLYGKPITRVENFCATGTDAFRNAAMAVASGMYDVVLVLGAEKLKDRPIRGLAREAAHPYMADGLTAPGIFAMAANRYFHRYGGGKPALAKVAVKNHANGSKNCKAHFQMEVTEEQVLGAPMVCDPLGLFDCCPTTDGAAAVVLCRADMARQFRSDYVLVKGLGLAVNTGRPWNQNDFEYVGFPSTQAAAHEAYRMAGIADPLKEIDLAEVHDCFTWTEISNYEDLGFCKKGEGIHFIGEGRSALSGDMPVNTSGGLKSFGHPIGASGVRMIYEVVTQLRQEAGARQVKDAELGLVHNLGGPGAVACVVVLGHH